MSYCKLYNKNTNNESKNFKRSKQSPIVRFKSMIMKISKICTGK